MQWTEIHSYSTDPQDSGQLDDVTPVPSLQHLLESDIECHYFGCYAGARFAYDNNYFFTFSTATCTFSQIVQGQHLLKDQYGMQWQQIFIPL